MTGQQRERLEAWLSDKGSIFAGFYSGVFGWFPDVLN